MEQISNRLSIIALVGPTAIGKSRLGIQLAHRLNGEIISADSRQLYRGFDIGSGKVTLSDMDGIAHHLIDIRDIWEGYSVEEFQQDASQCVEDIHTRNHLPILVGGTGLYVDALIKGYVIPEVAPNYALRKKLEQKSLTELQSTYQTLVKEQSLNNSDYHNPVRLIRKIEQALSGSVEQPTQSQPSYTSCIIGLTATTDTLRKRIALRVQERLESGVIEETSNLLETLGEHMSQDDALKKLSTFGLGTVAILEYIQGSLSYEQLVSRYITKEYQYAKRQLTWFKREPNIHWLDISKKDSLKESAIIIKKFLLLN